GPVCPRSRHPGYRCLYTSTEVQWRVMPDRGSAAAEAFDPVRHIADRAGDRDGGSDAFSWVSRAELGTYTRDQLLRDIDVMSMAPSLEVRVPLLDDRLVETALRLPDAAKRNGGRPKSLLVDAVGDLLPQEIRSRRAKQGFVFPFGAWLRGPLRHHCDGWSE